MVTWNDTIQALVIKRLLDGLTYSAEGAYRENRFLNTLVILDEAHRLAPREKIENLSSLHREIIAQLIIFFFGFGLALGTEFMSQV